MARPFGNDAEIAAIVVATVDHGEAHRIVRLLTPQGRLAAFAPSARTSRKRFGGALQPFTSILAHVQLPKSDRLPLLRSVETRRFRLGLSKNLETLALAAYLSELAEQLAPEGIETEVVPRLEGALDRMLKAGSSVAERRSFELQLLDELGYRPELYRCGECEQPGETFDLVRGGVFCRTHRKRGRLLGPKTRAWLEGRLAGLREPWMPLLPEEAERAAGLVAPELDRALEQLLPRPLASVALLNTVTARSVATSRDPGSTPS